MDAAPELMYSTARRDSPVSTTCSPSYSRTLILDLGDVLFHWDVRALTSLSPSALHSVILTPTWGELECGNISEEEALERIGEELSLEPSKIQEAIGQCRQTLSVDLDLVSKLQTLKKEMDGSLRVCAM
jgi:hypothetical protein